MQNNKNIIIVSTPRSGSTWVNYCLSDALKIPSLGVHRYTDLDDYPEKGIILQIHAQANDKGLRDFIVQNNFKVITVARHPLDVLISILRFVQSQTSPLQWLDGQVDIEKIIGKTPADKEFIDWCLGKGARKLLEISYKWSMDENSTSVKYEDLVDAPQKTLENLVARANFNISTQDISRSLKKFDVDFFNSSSMNHGWRSVKNNWVNFFTKEDAEKIYIKNKDIFSYFNYDTEMAVNTKKSQNLKMWDKKKENIVLKEYYYKAIKELEKQNKKTFLLLIKQNQELDRVNNFFANLNKKKDKEINRLQGEVTESGRKIAELTTPKEEQKINQYLKKSLSKVRSETKNRLNKKQK